MANTILLKRRIKTAQNVSKTTKAMQMIAASKLKRAQNAALASRPYVEKLTSLTKNLSKNLDKELLHPYMKENDSKRTLLIVLSPDKGLCGGLITNLLREYLQISQDEKYLLITVGKKIEHQAVKDKNTLLASFPIGNTLPSFAMVPPIQKIIDEEFLSGNVSSVKILYSNFVSVFTQIPVIVPLLPVKVSDDTHLLFRSTNTKVPVKTKEQETDTTFEIYEPAAAEMLPELLKHYIEMNLYHYLLESHLSEQAARMLAMQNATDNTRDIITQLTLVYNKARQEKITNEILDISSGAAINYE